MLLARFATPVDCCAPSPLQHQPGHDSCCKPRRYCLGPTCTHRNQSYGVYDGRLVFFFAPMVKGHWDVEGAAANLAAADADWGAFVAEQSIPPLDGDHGDIAACFNTDYLWCLDPGPPRPPPFPQCPSA